MKNLKNVDNSSCLFVFAKAMWEYVFFSLLSVQVPRVHCDLNLKLPPSWTIGTLHIQVNNFFSQ